MDMNDPLYQHMSDELAVWRGIGEKVRGEYRAIPQRTGPPVWLRFGGRGQIEAEPLTDAEARLIFGDPTS